MTIERIDSPNLFKSPGFPAVTIASGGRTAFINGQVARDAAGLLVGSQDHVAQARQAFANLRHALQAAGACGSDVLQYRVTVVDCAPDLIGPIFATMREAFVDDPIEAPSILVGATMLGRPEYLVEIEAIAALSR